MIPMRPDTSSDGNDDAGHDKHCKKKIKAKGRNSEKSPVSRAEDTSSDDLSASNLEVSDPENHNKSF